MRLFFWYTYRTHLWLWEHSENQLREIRIELKMKWHSPLLQIRMRTGDKLLLLIIKNWFDVQKIEVGIIYLNESVDYHTLVCCLLGRHNFEFRSVSRFHGSGCVAFLISQMCLSYIIMCLHSIRISHFTQYTKKLFLRMLIRKADEEDQVLLRQCHIIIIVLYAREYHLGIPSWASWFKWLLGNAITIYHSFLWASRDILMLRPLVNMTLADYFDIITDTRTEGIR